MSTKKKKATKKTKPNLEPHVPPPEPPSSPAPRKDPPQSDLPAMEGPGVALPDFPDIDAAAEEYISVRDRRMELTKKEVPARDAVAQLMQEHGLTEYRFGDYKVKVVTGKIKVSVKNAASEDMTVGDGGNGDGE